MPASLDDILTAQKNGVVALNNIQQALAAQNATTTSDTVNANKLIVTGKGRLISFAVVVAGSTIGKIYNFGAPTGYTDPNALVATPNVIGVYPVDMVFSNGLYVSVGTGQSVNVTYLLG